MSPAGDPLASLRAGFPALERLAYLNSGSNGPAPAEGIAAARAELERQAERGRGRAHFERRAELARALRGVYAGLLGADPGEVALTTATSDGLARVIAGLGLGRGDEIVTSDQEHPGLLGPLAALRSRGARVLVAPLAEVANAAGPRTRLVACSHVSWVGGETAPPELAELDAPVLLDGAQGVGAVAVDVAALGCDAYAGAGQKWLCGPDGTGMLHLSPALRERLDVPGPGYVNLADAGAGLEAAPHDDARALDAPALPAEGLAFALAAAGVLATPGWDALHARAAGLAASLAERLRERGREVLPRGATTLVAWRDERAAETVERLAAAGVVVRELPGRGLVRASVGAWNDEQDLERLLAGLG